MLKEKPKKSKAQRKRAKKRASNSVTTTNSEAELPSRSRRKLPRQSRHFRFMLEVDEKLQDLVDHYDGTMTYVMSRLIHEEWVRMKRKERRSAKKAGDDDDDDAEGSARGAG